MIITDKLLEKLEKENKPIKVGMVGAGFMAKGIVLQIEKYTKGMDLAAISNRTTKNAQDIYKKAGVKKTIFAKTQKEFDKAISQNKRVVTDNFELLCRSKNIDVILEATGTVEFGAKVALVAIKNKKHFLINAELDGTLGPILKVYADKAGVVITNPDGDQPGVTLNLYRFVKSLGLKPVLCGNIKGLHDPYRNPKTQEGFAKMWGQKPEMVTTFADGTKISFEQAIIANATGMKVAKRGMHGPTVPEGTRLEEAADWYPKKDLLKGNGIVDYVVGADPAPGVFVLAKSEDPVQKHYLNLYKLGKGPFYCFYAPYHLCHFEVANSIARAYFFKDATTEPIAEPMCDVITIAKKDLKKGEKLDGLGGFTYYGAIENADISKKGKLLPVGLAEDCILQKDIKKDTPITYDDIVLPKNRISDKLRKEQNEKFFK
jgi:predicted homoserine dehydrogenase-like protein